MGNKKYSDLPAKRFGFFFHLDNNEENIFIFFIFADGLLSKIGYQKSAQGKCVSTDHM